MARSLQLAEVAPELARILNRGAHPSPVIAAAARFGLAEIRCDTVNVTMRDGTRLATDVYLPPLNHAPTIAVRTPYGRAADGNVALYMSLVRRGYAVVAQDCRGTGDSEPDSWDYYVYEREDSLDFVDWVAKQPWYNGFIGGCGGSYLAQTQWCMSMHPAISTIVPVVGGLGIAYRTVHKYLFYEAYARSIGKGEGKVPLHYTEMERPLLHETRAGGYYNEPLNHPLPREILTLYPQVESLPPAQRRKWLWEKYCSLSADQRAQIIKQALGHSSVTNVSIDALQAVFGHRIAHDAHMFPSATPKLLAQSIFAPALLVTGWYDWSLHDPLATWQLLRDEAREEVRSGTRLIITPGAHTSPGYHEGRDDHPELERSFTTPNLVELLLVWYSAIREGTIDSWPRVIYYLMGANDWRVASDWPPPSARKLELYLDEDGRLSTTSPRSMQAYDSYLYDPENPTPTVGGSIVSYIYPPGSVDVSAVQARSDVVTYTTQTLERDLDVVGPLRLVLYASSSAKDTDFTARLSDVFPDGRAIQLQTGILRARYRDAEPEFLEPTKVYRFEIDMWATANRFRSGHRLRLDVSSADFPRFDRNTNRAGEVGPPVVATQTIYRDANHPSHLIVSVLGRGDIGDLGVL